jgi:ssDNA-binding Zn-finger/Zn-ribbon topoisomerase 1
MTEKNEEKKDKIRCSKCGSSLVYVRIKDKQRVYHSCFYVEQLGENNDKRQKA